MKYILLHKKTFIKIEKQLFGRNTLKGIFHDVDKLLLVMFIGIEATSSFHIKRSSHHDKAKSVSDFRRKVIDWECARITKPDKQLNAYDTLYKLHPEQEKDILPILKECGIAYSELKD